MKYQNPIIKGYNPDPSICRVNDDYYLVTSTFEFFPGVPIYHSKNLVNWELINHCLTDESQLPLKDCRCSGGIYAPTIRYNNGTFYMVTTNVSHGGNFYVTTNDIYGKWSNPIYVDQGGIDPSLLFHKDKVYFCSTHKDENGKQCIGCCEIDILTGKKLTETKIISYGTGGTNCEAPHIYKIGEFFYLITAEGGTEYGHMVCVLRSNSIYGPYENSPYGPVLTHKNYMGAQIQATGHADLFQDENNNWWLVALGIRKLKSTMLHNLGRETFLSPVKFTDDLWPIAGNNGTIELEMDADLPKNVSEVSNDFFDDFTSDKLNLNWTYVRNRVKSSYKQDKGLTLFGNENTLNDFTPTFLGIRQKEFCMTAETFLTIKTEGYSGISAFYNMAYHYDLYIEKTKQGNFIVFSSTIHALTAVHNKISINSDTASLKIVSDNDFYTFHYKNDDEYIELGKASTAGLCTEGTMMMTFTGTFFGLFSVNSESEFTFFKAAENDSTL